MLEFLKNLFKNDDTIIGLYRFEGKFCKRQKITESWGVKYQFERIENPFFKASSDALKSTKFDILDNILLV